MHVRMIVYIINYLRIFIVMALCIRTIQHYEYKNTVATGGEVEWQTILYMSSVAFATRPYLESYILQYSFLIMVIL